MSFYGSVYYQLIDAFYKVIVRNQGKNSNRFIDGNENKEVAAQGRHGVFGFDSGNKWINLGFTEELKPDSKETYSIYQIYHGRPDTETTQENHGFKALVDLEEDGRVGEDGIIQLNPHDVFETYESIYDEAGHIARTEKVTYRLPKSDMDNRVMELERLVGTDADRTMPEMGEGDANLYGYVEENCKDISKLEEYQGEWTVHAAKSWSPTNKKNGVGYAPTIAETIGNLNDMYVDYPDRVKNFKSFVEIVGKLAGLKEITTLEDGTARSAANIIDAIVIEKERLDTLNGELQKHQNTSNGAFEGIYSMIGEKIDNDKNIYGHIRQLYSDDSVMRSQLNWSGRTTTTVSGELDSHDLRVKNLEDYRNTLDNTTLPAITGRLDTLDTQTKEHYAAWEEAETEFKAAHEDIYAKMGTVPTEKNIMGIIGEFKTTVNSTFGNVPEGSNVMHEIKSVEDKALDLIGTVPENSSVMSELTSSVNSLIELIGEIPEDSSVSAELTSIQNEVDTLEGVVGAIPEGDTAYGLISANASDIVEIKEHMGDKVDNKTLSARISENASNMSTLVTTTLPNTYVSKTELTNANYATATELNEVETALVSVVGDLAKMDELKENASDKTIALLQDIFNRLTILEEKVETIEKSLNNDEPPTDDPEPDDEGTTDPEPDNNETTEPGEEEPLPDVTDPEEGTE